MICKNENILLKMHIFCYNFLVNQNFQYKNYEIDSKEDVSI